MQVSQSVQRRKKTKTMIPFSLLLFMSPVRIRREMVLNRGLKLKLYYYYSCFGLETFLFLHIGKNIYLLFFKPTRNKRLNLC